LRALVFGVWILLATTGLLSDLAMRLVDLSGLSVSLITIYLVVFNKPTKRTLHDFIVGSIVIKTDYKNCDLSDDFEMVWDKHKYKILLVCVLTLIIYIAFPQ
jgi:uncharacterized RDD family membrane protein YckC